MEKSGRDPRNWEILAKLQKIAEAWGHSPAETALAWVMGPPVLDLC